MGLGLPLLVGLITIPLLLAGIGNELFGLLSIIWILIGYFSMFDLGMGRALTQRIAFLNDDDNKKNIPKVITTGLVFLVMVGILGGGILALLAKPLAYDWLNASLSLQNDIYHSLLLVALVIPAITLSTGLRGTLEAIHNFKTVNLIRLIHGLANFLAPLIVYWIYGASLVYITLSLVFFRLLFLIVYFIAVYNVFLVKLENFCREEAKHLFKFGSWMTLTNIVSPLMNNADKFVISAHLGASKVAFYTVPFDILARVLILPASITSALFPKFSNLWPQEIKELKSLYYRSIILVLTIMVPVCAVLFLYSEMLLRLWVDDDFASNSWLVASILTIGVLLNGVARVPFSAIQSFGEAKVTAKIHLAEALVYLPVMYILVKHYGLIGAAIAWSTRVFVDMLLLLFIAHKKINRQLELCVLIRSKE